MSTGIYCRECGAELRQGRVAGYHSSNGEPFYVYECPNDRWWKVLTFHTLIVGGRTIR